MLAGILAMWLVVPGARAGVTFTALVSFGGTNGSAPYAGLVQGSDGNFYGTAYLGGTSNLGTVFRMTPAGALTRLVSFNGTNGANPWAGLVQAPNGNLFGATVRGGTNDVELVGDGTAFRMTTGGTLTRLVSFDGTNGRAPYGGLVLGADGNFYGTTEIGGGGDDAGTVFKMTTNGALTRLVSFAQTNGYQPFGALVQGSDGNFYGTTQIGGTNGSGTVFQVTADGTLTSLYSFTGLDDGANPYAGLVQGADGNFYGTTFNGGASSLGTVFTVTTNGALAPLYGFTGGDDGANPYGGLVQGPDGNFYGTTGYGGASANGTVFQISPNGALTNLYSFTGGNDGANPVAGLLLAKDGNFYGTTSAGGTNGFGTIFRIRVPMPPVFKSVTVAGSTLTFTWSAVAGLSYRVQYSTNLAKTNWNNLGNSFTATNGTATTSDTIGPNPQRFYRAVLLP